MVEQIFGRVDMIKRALSVAFCLAALSPAVNAGESAIELSPAQMDGVTAGAWELYALSVFNGGGQASGGVQAGASFYAQVQPYGIFGNKNPSYSAIARSEVNVLGSGAEQSLYAQADTETKVPTGPDRIAIGVKSSDTINLPEVGIAFSYSTEMQVSIAAPSRVPFGFVAPW
jgi:hypothetical protein